MKQTDRTPPPLRTVSGGDLYGEDLTGRVESRIAYVDVDLTEATSTSGTLFEECVFRHVKFNVAELTGAAFTNCLFANCNFFDAKLTGCKLVGSTFERCEFDRLTVDGGDWSFAVLVAADLRKVSFTDVRMREADLSSARGDGATFRRVDLSGAVLAKASLVKADLRGSDLGEFDPATVDLRGAIIDIGQAIAVASAYGLDVRAD